MTSNAGDTPHRRLDSERRDAARQIIRSTLRLAAGAASGFPPEADLLLALENLGVLAREAIDAEFPVRHTVDDMEARLDWFHMLYFLSRTKAFPALDQLGVALAELDRGRHPESLKPFYTGKGSGARTTPLELTVQQQAVEAADRVASFCVKDEERDTIFASCGVSARTIERYRESCMKGWPIYWPREDACAELDRGAAEDALRSAMQHAKLLQAERPSKSARAK